MGQQRRKEEEEAISLAFLGHGKHKKERKGGRRRGNKGEAKLCCSLKKADIKHKKKGEKKGKEAAAISLSALFHSNFPSLSSFLPSPFLTRGGAEIISLAFNLSPSLSSSGHGIIPFLSSSSHTYRSHLLLPAAAGHLSPDNFPSLPTHPLSLN